MAFGTLKTTYIHTFTDTDRREVVVLATLLVAMLLLGLSASLVLDFVHVAVKGIILDASQLRPYPLSPTSLGSSAAPA